MVSSIGNNVSQIQLLRAAQAFKKASNVNTQSIQETPDIQNETRASEDLKEGLKATKTGNTILSQKSEYVNQVKDFAQKNGFNQVDDDDIAYALRYGRSILVDQVV